MVQRMTDSEGQVRRDLRRRQWGRVHRTRQGQERRSADHQKAIDNAKLNMIEIKRGCGFGSGCGTAHRFPTVVGKCGPSR